MLSKVVLLALAGFASCAVIDDGSYDAQRYEIPYHGETSDNTRSARTYSAPAGGNYVQSAPASRNTYTSDSRNAQILSDARYLSADGKFGSSYTQEDGVQFKEEADPDGTRRGSYSWVDPGGQRRTVSYVAGKFGFQASGEHLPEQPPVVVNPEPEHQQYAAPQSRYVQPQPQAQPQSRYVQPQPQYQPEPQQYSPPQSRYVQPQAQPQYSQPQQPQYAPEPQQPQYAPEPAYRPQYRAEEPVQRLDGPGPSHPTITQSTGDSYSISAAF